MPQETTAPTTKTRPTLTLDVDKYQHMLDAPDMSEDQKKELLEALWLFVVSFVDLGFDVHSAEDFCGKSAEIRHANAQSPAVMLHSNHSPKSAVFASAANTTATKQEAS